MTWHTAHILVIDTETTGVRPGRDRITELGAVRFHGGQITPVIDQLVNPCCPIPKFITELTGITDGDVADAPPLDHVAPELYAAVQAADVLVAYNAPFDFGMLAGELGDSWRKATAGKPWLDPLPVARRNRVHDPKLGKPSYRLGSVALCILAKELLEGVKTHRAVADATLTGHVLYELRGMLSEDATEAARQCAGWGGRKYRSLADSIRRHLAETGYPTPEAARFLPDACASDPGPAPGPHPGAGPTLEPASVASAGDVFEAEAGSP